MRLCACVLWSGNLFAWGASSRCYCDLGWFSLLLMPASTCNLFLCVASLPLWLFASTYLLANVARTSNKSDKDVCSRFSWKTCMRCRRRAHRTNFDKIIPFIWARQILILQSADGLAEKFATTQRLHVHTNMLHYGSCITLQWHELLIMLMCKKITLPHMTSICCLDCFMFFDDFYDHVSMFVSFGSHLKLVHSSSNCSHIQLACCGHCGISWYLYYSHCWSANTFACHEVAPCLRQVECL